MLYPFLFEPRFKERIWGGQNLARLYGKPLPAGRPIGESWEITDRPGDVSVITNGPLAGRDLRWLMEHHAPELLGAAEPAKGRFPLLVKLLDARDRLSLQVHPPARLAEALGGEPKTEVWYVADAAPAAELYVGLRSGVTRESFEQRLKDGAVADCFHRIAVQSGDVMFLPSGRVHAIGAGLVLFEIQQNSDTTYRVFDWNRAGLDGQPRELHVAQSLASIDFDDIEPGLSGGRLTERNGLRIRELVNDPLFRLEEASAAADWTGPLTLGQMQIVATLRGQVIVESAGVQFPLAAGQFCLIPAVVPDLRLLGSGGAAFLRVAAG